MSGAGTKDGTTGTGSRGKVLFAVGLLAALLLAGVVSLFASSSPDGLERVALDHGFTETAQDHDLAGSPFAEYGTAGVEDERLSGALAGVVGVAATLLVAGGLFLLLRRRPARDGEGTGTEGTGTEPRAGVTAGR